MADHLKLKSAQEEIARLNVQLSDARAEHNKLVLAIGDHVTVRGEYYARALAAEERARKAEEERDEALYAFHGEGLAHIAAKNREDAERFRADAAEAKLAEAREALEPFAAWHDANVDDWDQFEGDARLEGGSASSATVADLRRAAALLAETTEGGAAPPPDRGDG